MSDRAMRLCSVVAIGAYSKNGNVMYHYEKGISFHSFR